MAATPEPLLVIAFQSTQLANGGVSSLLQLLSRLKRFRARLVTQVDSAAAERWRATGGLLEIWPIAIPLTATRRVGVWERFGAMVVCNARVYSHIKRTATRVVHCNDLYAMMYAALGARLAGAAVVHNIRDTLGVGGLKWSVARLVANRVIVLSSDMRSIVERQTAWPRWVPQSFVAPVEAIYSVVDFETMKPLASEPRQVQRAELGLAEGEFSVGIVGAIVPKKQQLEFVLALGRLRALLPANVRFWFVGDFTPETNAYAKACQEAVRAANLEEIVRFVGYSENIANWYQCLDCVVCTSAHEGLARAMIEGLACGTGVISFDVASAREILEEHQCGVVVRQGDYAALLQAIAGAASDAGAWSRFGLRALQVTRELFDGTKVAAAYEEIYTALAIQK